MYQRVIKISVCFYTPKHFIGLTFQFCALVSIGCLVLMWIGRSVSGTTLLYLIFMSLLLTPGICIHVLPAVSQLDWQGQLEKIGTKGMPYGFIYVIKYQSYLILTFTLSLWFPCLSRK